MLFSSSQFFFVLRKKQEQVSVLHVVHHGIMPMSVWFGLRFTPGGHSTFFGLLNTLVHVVMYFYYMVSAMGPKYAKFIWWKKYLTAFQMVKRHPLASRGSIARHAQPCDRSLSTRFINALFSPCFFLVY